MDKQGTCLIEFQRLRDLKISSSRFLVGKMELSMVQVGMVLSS